jgi:hypothetical protein
MTVDGSAQTTGVSDHCVKVSWVENVTIDNIEVFGENNGLEAYSINYCTIKNIYAHDCGHHGIHSGTNTLGYMIGNVFQNCYVWDNALVEGNNGFDDIGNQSYPTEDLGQTFDNIQAWNNGSAGIAIYWQKGATIKNCDSYENVGRGMSLAVLTDLTMEDSSADENGAEGINLNTVTDSFLTRVTAHLNTSSNLGTSDCSGITYTACDFED